MIQLDISNYNRIFLISFALRLVFYYYYYHYFELQTTE